MKTFTEIEFLLMDIERIQTFNQIMLSSGAANRTDAGSGVFLSMHQQNMDVLNKLRKYPYQWINAVKIIIALRSKPGRP